VSALIPSSGGLPVPYEQMLAHVPELLLHLSGPNRNPGHSQMRARTDLEAIESWLREYEDSPQTFRAYRKEVERFLNWLVLVAQVPFSAVMREHIADYQRFLADPQPAELWCAPRYLRRTEPGWRPFEGPLTLQSQGLALSVLGSLFGYLRDLGYLLGSPLMRKRRARGRTGAQSTSARKKRSPAKRAQRYIPPALMTQVLDTLTALAEAEPPGRRKLELERALFVVRFLANTGLRRAELASAKLEDLDVVQDAEGNSVRILHILGKGAREREVVLTPASLEALTRYHAQYDIASFSGVAAPILLSITGSNFQSLAPLEESQVYRFVQEAFEWAADALEAAGELAVVELERLRATTPHWMRRTYATLCLERGIALKHLQTQLGHRSASTTLGYQSSEITNRYQGLFGAQL
jgi:integrase/recombinase XerD